MSLIGFHKLLILTAILFCALFSVWQGVRFVGGGGALNLTLAVAFGIAAAALAYYLANLRRFLHKDG